MKSKSGLDKLGDFISKTQQIKEDGESNKKEVINDKVTFDDMVISMKDFIINHPYARKFALKIGEDHGKFYVYQGSKSCLFAVLNKNGRCIFPRTSFLRAIKNLPDDHNLHKYFEEYTLVR